MTKNIIFSSLALICAGIFFVINDAIINYLAPLDIQFYHFIFYGIPAYICVPIYLLFSGKFRLIQKRLNGLNSDEVGDCEKVTEQKL